MPAALLLTFSLAACGTFAEKVEAPPNPARLQYLNPPRPDPVIPPQVQWGPVTVWKENDVPASELVCTRVREWVDSRVFLKEIAFWMKHANAALEFHERMNVSATEDNAVGTK